MAAALCLPSGAMAQYVDVLERPAQNSARAASALLNGLALAGARLVAVGQRGHILYSDDSGLSWRQARVPVSSDLTAVHFPSESRGWAVGHDGVVLHSEDGGVSWQLQLDGMRAIRIMENYYRNLPQQAISPDEAAKLTADLAQFAAEGPDKPFLDVWFENEHTGFIVGAFGLIFRTEDGGRNWQPWYHRADNPRGLHLYALKPADGALYATGEQGLVLKLDHATQRFRALMTGYGGTYFGVIGSGNAVLVFGLRGNIHRSTDGGLNWRKVDASVLGNINAGSAAPDGSLYLVTQTGQILMSRDTGISFAVSAMETPMSAGAVAVQDQTLILAGRRGVRTQRLQ
ncbi:MAG: glycosyl hydrolase [Zoogloeaceae bacterium]|nr:glycosyl hydrolase [Zoogloeaceae bacterium]